MVQLCKFAFIIIIFLIFGIWVCILSELYVYVFLLVNALPTGTFAIKFCEV